MVEHREEDRSARPHTGVRGGRAAMPRWLLVAVAITIVFVLALGWQWWHLRGVTADLDSVRTELSFTRLEATLAAATVEAHEGSYEVSRQYASAFFTGLQSEIERAPRDARESLQAILQQRDDLITQLTRGDPQTALVLSRLLGSYRAAIRP